MRNILISFDHDWFKKLENNEIIFEYRKVLPAEEVMAYFYVSNPIKAISGIAHFGRRELLSSWKDKFCDRPNEVLARINEYLDDCKYVVPILSFQKTQKIPLDKIRMDIPKFIVPRMYYYLDDSELLTYLNKNLSYIGPIKRNSFNYIKDDDICI